MSTRRRTSYNVGHGRFFTAAEIEHTAPVAVIGADVKDAIFPREDPIGKDDHGERRRYTVVGVLAHKGEQFGWSPDNKVVLPLRTFDRQFPVQGEPRDGVHISVVPAAGPRTSQRHREGARRSCGRAARCRSTSRTTSRSSTPDQLIEQFQGDHRRHHGRHDLHRAHLARSSAASAS